MNPTRTLLPLLQMLGAVLAVNTVAAQQNIYAVDFDVNIKMDVISGLRARWTFINDVAAYTS